MYLARAKDGERNAFAGCVLRRLEIDCRKPRSPIAFLIFAPGHTLHLLAIVVRGSVTDYNSDSSRPVRWDAVEQIENASAKKKGREI